MNGTLTRKETAMEKLFEAVEFVLDRTILVILASFWVFIIWCIALCVNIPLLVAIPAIVFLVLLGSYMTVMVMVLPES